MLLLYNVFALKKIKEKSIWIWSSLDRTCI